MEISHVFARIAQRSSHEAGRPWAFILALAVVILWALTGPVFGYSDTWQLVINTGTTVITFLMVFLIQNSQNRDTQAIQLKLDELIRASEGAHNRLMALENQSEEALQQVKEELAEACDEPPPIPAEPAQAR
jgi:low affinity Fe/Cu permease